ncbi:MAG: tyrosine recombinase XerC [Oscillospiraceae bacterium]
MIKYSLHINTTTNIYQVMFRIPTQDGKLKQKCLSTGIKATPGHKREAEAKAKAIVEQYEGLICNDKSEMTLGEYAADWTERRKPTLRPTTYDNYKSMLNKHIKPYFMQRKLKIRDVKPYHLQEYINTKLESGLTPNTIKKHIALIKTALQDAVINDLIKSNAAYKITLPKSIKPSYTVYNAEELKHLLEVAETSPIRIPIILAMCFGLRRSEVIGLKWENIDFEKHTLSICGSVTRQYQNGKLKDIHNLNNKTEASQSTYILNERMTEFLKNLYEHNQQIISNTDDYKTFVCVNAIGERIKLDYVTHKFAKLLKDNNLNHIRFHDLRHSCITLLANDSNFTMKQVQGYARHADFSTTANTYSHFDISTTETELNAICDFIGIA